MGIHQSVSLTVKMSNSPDIESPESESLSQMFQLHVRSQTDNLDFGEFLGLAITRKPNGLGLFFKKGEADALFSKIDVNKDGFVSLKELLDYFSSSQEDKDVMPAKKRIALVAHDNMKEKLVDWCRRWKEVLSEHSLMGTGTTARKVKAETGLEVEILQSGPFGGDQQIGARIAQHQCDILIFFWDPLAAMAHDQYVKALFRIASLYNVMMATNCCTADMIISNSLVGEQVFLERPNMSKYINRKI